VGNDNAITPLHLHCIFSHSAFMLRQPESSMTSEPYHESAEPTGQVFNTTHWSVVLAARNEHSPRAAAALETLCRDYWFPLYAYVRRCGHDTHEAQDLTQVFFQQMLEKSFLRSVDRNKGKFRSWLLACLNHFLAKDWRDRHTLKRGGAITFIPLDLSAEQERFAVEVPADLPPEHLYDRQWALAVLDQAMGRVEQEMTEAGKTPLFQALRQFLIEPTHDGGYEPVAQCLGMTPAAVRMAALRLRQRFRELVRATVADTVTTPLELEEELRYLRRLLAQ
jgi:RNA polymerase sigma-70 factor (ECF subfamily)